MWRPHSQPDEQKILVITVKYSCHRFLSWGIAVSHQTIPPPLFSIVQNSQTIVSNIWSQAPFCRLNKPRYVAVWDGISLNFGTKIKCHICSLVSCFLCNFVTYEPAVTTCNVFPTLVWIKISAYLYCQSRRCIVWWCIGCSGCPIGTVQPMHADLIEWELPV